MQDHSVLTRSRPGRVIGQGMRLFLNGRWVRNDYHFGKGVRSCGNKRAGEPTFSVLTGGFT